jgi:hypothetical protein
VGEVVTEDTEDQEKWGLTGRKPYTAARAQPMGNGGSGTGWRSMAPARVLERCEALRPNSWRYCLARTVVGGVKVPTVEEKPWRCMMYAT